MSATNGENGARHAEGLEPRGRPERDRNPERTGHPEHAGRPEHSREIEPEIDPDSDKRLLEELPETAHTATRFDAGTGQGTVSGPPKGVDFQERPILDGSTQDPVAESSVPNPHRGQDDPAAMKRQPALNSTNTNRWLIASVIAAAVMTVVLLVLMPWNPLWCGIGVTVALVGVLAMLAVRASRIGLKARLRIDAVLMAIVWLVPLAIFIVVLLTSADEIWNRAV